MVALLSFIHLRYIASKYTQFKSISLSQPSAIAIHTGTLSKRHIRSQMASFRFQGPAVAAATRRVAFIKDGMMLVGRADPDDDDEDPGTECNFAL